MGVVHEDAISCKQIIVGGKQTGARTGRPAEFRASTEFTMGGFFNAGKAYMDFGAAGKVSGLGSAF